MLFRSHSNNSIAITGKAFQLLCERESKEYIDVVLNRCRVFGNLTDSNRTQILKLLREKNREQPIGYVYEDTGSEKIINEADVSINLKANSLSPYSVFSSEGSDLGQVVEIIKESKATFANLSQVVFFSLFFILLQIVGFFVLILDRKSTRLNSSHIPLFRMPSSA